MAYGWWTFLFYRQFRIRFPEESSAGVSTPFRGGQKLGEEQHVPRGTPGLLSDAIRHNTRHRHRRPEDVRVSLQAGEPVLFLYSLKRLGVFWPLGFVRPLWANSSVSRHVFPLKQNQFIVEWCLPPMYNFISGRARSSKKQILFLTCRLSKKKKTRKEIVASWVSHSTIWTFSWSRSGRTIIFRM